MTNFKRTIPSLTVTNIKKAVEFYETKMGFYAKHKEETFAAIVRGVIEIHLWACCDRGWKFRSLALFLRPICSGTESFLAGTANCRIEVEGIDELYEEYRAPGIL